MTGIFQTSPSFLPSSRAKVSFDPPGGYGTTIVTGFEGQWSCAAAGIAPSAASMHSAASVFIIGIVRSLGAMSLSLRASARIASARRTKGASTILPLTVKAPMPLVAASRAASMTLSECAISASVGRKTALASATCDGWMQLLPR